MKKLNARGFGAIETILILVIIGIIGGAGYFVYSSQKKTNASLDNAPKSQNDTQKNVKKEASISGSYEIKEWGVKVALRDSEKIQFDVKDVRDQMGSSNDFFDGYATPSFKPEFLLDKSCKPGLTLYRSKVVFASALKESQKQIGEYYYAIDGGPAACGSDPQNNPTADDQLESRFLQDFNISNVTSIK